MANEQMNITQAVAKATQAMIQAIAAANAENNTRQSVGPKVGVPMMKHPTFNLDTKDKYSELKNFRLQINNIFKSYNM